MKQLSSLMMLIKMLSCWMTWEAASHIASACKQLLLDLQTEVVTLLEAPGVVIMVATMLPVVQGAVDILGRGEPSLDNPTFVLLIFKNSSRRNRVPIEEIANLLRFSDPLSVIRGGRGGGRGGTTSRVGVTHGHLDQGFNNSPQAKNASSGSAGQQTNTPQKTTQKRPSQQRPIQRNASPILSLATPDSFFSNAKRVENTQPHPTTGKSTIRQPVTRQAATKKPTTKQPATGKATTKLPTTNLPTTKPPATKPPATKLLVTKPPTTEPRAIESPAPGKQTTGQVDPASKPNKAPCTKSTLEMPKNNAPDIVGTISSKDNDEDLIFCDLISLEDNDKWVSTSTEVGVEERPSGYMQDMWTLEENANAVFNMIVEVTRKGMAKEKQVRGHIMDSLANGVIPDGRGITSSVYASDEPPVTKESINTYWKTQGPSFRKGLENESIRLILEGAAAEIVRRDAPTSSDLGQQDISGKVSEADQPNLEEGLKQTVPGDAPEYAQPNPQDLFKQSKQVNSLDSVANEPQGFPEPTENISDSEETAGDQKKPEVTFLQYGASELLQLRSRALTVEKSAFPDEIRPFVIKDTRELLQKPKTIKVLGGLADSEWASTSKSIDENVTPNKINAVTSKTSAIPSKANSTPSKVNFDPSKASFVPSNLTHRSMGSSSSNVFVEETQSTRATRGVPASKGAEEPKASDTYTLLDFVSAISSATVPACPKRRGLNDSIWADSSPSKGSMTRPSINREVVDRMINPTLTHSNNKERRKKSIHIITEATKRRIAVLEKEAAEKEAAIANDRTTNFD